jgi:hypothetical protein
MTRQNLFFALLLCCSSAFADVTGFAGLDHIASTDTTVRYLPGYKSTELQTNTGFLRASNSYKLSSTTDLNVVLSSDVETQFKLDKLEVDTKLDYIRMKNAGVRFGILPYRVSWCRKYEADSIWIQEPDVFCKQKTLREMSSSGTGIQYYRSSFADEHIIDAQISFYKPTLYGDETMAVYIPEGKTESHNKIGVSVNALNLKTATQFRLGYLKTWQSVRGTTTGDHLYNYDAMFIGAEKAVRHWRFRGTVAGYYGLQSNLPDQFKFSATSTTAEVEYSSGPHHYGLGYSVYQNTTSYMSGAKPMTLKVSALTAAYRLHLKHRESIIVQVGTSDEALRLSSFSDVVPREKSGKFIMMRYLITF